MPELARRAVLAYAVVAYAAFVAGVLWAVAFLADVGPLPTVDGATTPWAPALAVDGALLLAFAVQHTVMARAGFKRRLLRLVPAAAERSTFVLASSLVMFALLGWWQPLPGVVWQLDAPWSGAVRLGYAAAWVLVVASTFQVDHGDFVGLKQAHRYRWRLAYRPPGFTGRGLYTWCRHPMMLGLVLAFWLTPRMTAGHLLFALASTGYVLVGIRFEERDLRAQLGAEYAEYAARVPALVPLGRTGWRGRRDATVAGG